MSTLQAWGLHGPGASSHTHRESEAACDPASLPMRWDLLILSLYIAMSNVNVSICMFRPLRMLRMFYLIKHLLINSVSPLENCFVYVTYTLISLSYFQERFS